MKNLILKLIGLEPEKVKALRDEMNVLIETIEVVESLSQEALDKCTEAIVLYNELGIDPNKEKWWEEGDPFYHDNNKRILAHGIKKNAQKDWIKKNPEVKERIIFHGGCLGCQTPINEGCGVCLGCNYFDFNNGKPDLSTQLTK